MRVMVLYEELASTGVAESLSVGCGSPGAVQCKIIRVIASVVFPTGASRAQD